MLPDRVAFLRARLDEDEAAANAATAGPWTVDDEGYAEEIRAGDGTAVVAGGRWGGEASVFDSTADALHVARHDPARVLAQVAAYRAILDRAELVWKHSPSVVEATAWAHVVSMLCTGYADHPDYDEEWRPA